MNWERLYRILLRAYPRRYRERYEEPMAQLFRDQLRDANTLAKTVRFLIRVLSDLAHTVPARHLERWLVRFSSHWTYSESAKRALFFAHYVGASDNAQEITLEHLLLGILREDRKLGDVIVGRKGYSAIFEAIYQNRDRRVTVLGIPLSDACKKALACAASRRAAHKKITSRELLLAILNQPQSTAARLLREHADLSRLDNSPG